MKKQVTISMKKYEKRKRNVFIQQVWMMNKKLRQIARYLPHHRSKNASKTHPKSSHDKFKTASKKQNKTAPETRLVIVMPHDY